MVRYKVLTGILLAPLAMVGCKSATGAAGLKALEAELKVAGYDLVYPITTGLPVGLLFQVHETTSGTKFRKSLCDSTFVNSKNTKETLVLASYTSSETDEYGLVLSLAEALLKDKAAAKASFKNGNVSKVDLKFNNVTGESLASKTQPTGISRAIDPNCKINVKTAIDENGNFTRPTVLVIGRARTTSLDYTFEAKNKASASLSLLLKGLFNIEPSYLSDEDGKKAIQIKPDSGKTFTIGSQAIAIANAQILSEISTGFNVVFKQDMNPPFDVAASLRLPEKRPE